MSPPALPLDPAEFSPRFAAAAKTTGFAAHQYGEINGYPLLAYTKRTPGRHPRVYLSTGMHGDEPAPPWALLRLLEAGFFDTRCTWFLCPLLNPTGFTRRTRENFAGVDLNRDYKSLRATEVQAHVTWLQRQPRFDLVICAHEDWEAQGFYLYELNLGQHPTLAPAMLAAARAHSPIEAAAVIDGREIAEPGILRPVSDPLLRDTWPEALYLAYKHSTLDYTIETASAQPLEQRITTQAAVLRAAIEEFLR
ncbi:M14 family metallocarboxypeptidase [Opitutus sp. GAS368]|uniref:M14 family metallopeptidase n=1 Tax=Opitutus sp. GAS368 TaxID=1882749 RepID=UPI00087927D0|nr:M14 family metallocarboxypeptidase [Opitutus sp. GAS368]SDS51176.1 Succinylglutamate desuccinylase / Aspartoacylase family protein [Opitutus sp. GAS368]